MNRIGEKVFRDTIELTLLKELWLDFFFNLKQHIQNGGEMCGYYENKIIKTETKELK